MVIAKVISIFTFLFLFFAATIFGPYYQNAPLHAALLVFFIAAHCWQAGFTETASLVKFVLPFIGMLLLFGGIFQWMHLLGRDDWMRDSLLKTLVFPNSLLAVKLTLGCITYRDVLVFPMPQRMRRNIVIVKAVMEKCAVLLPRHRFFMETSPHFTHYPRLKRTFFTICGIVIAAYISIYQQTEKTQQLYNHRTQFLRKNP